MKCKVCSKLIYPFMSFGSMPIANGFLSKNQFKNEYYFDMEVVFCTNCYMFQLFQQPPREKMFNETYAFYSGTSKMMDLHFKKLSDDIKLQYLSDLSDPFVIEIGSNDGILLNNFKNDGIKHLGIEPSKNVASVAIEKNINTMVNFFGMSLSKKILNEYGQCDIFVAANVMCHIANIKSIFESIKLLLKPNGVLIFEDPYLGDVIEKTTYDQIYDEHVFLFSLHSIQHLVHLFDMEVIDINHLEAHGGSLRYTVAHRGNRIVRDIVEKQLLHEKNLGLTHPKTFEDFKNKCNNYKSDLITLLNNIKSDGFSIAGYAATSKSTTIMNYCGIGSNHLDFISDITPLKQGKYSPGTHIPIVSNQYFKCNYPDYALLFAYNHQEEIFQKEKEFIRNGGKWITYVPELKIIND